jgi:hypothetical protein
MRAAPAVRVTVQAPAWARAGSALLAALAAGAGTAWAAGHSLGAPVWGLAALLPGAVLGWWAGPAGRTELAWDGQRWHADGLPGRLTVQTDLHTALLLRFMPEGGGRARWLLPHRAGTDVHWHALRVALFAGRPEQPADPAGQPPLTP